MPVKRRGSETIAAVRGAITVPENRAEAIREATARLLIGLLESNRLERSQIVSAVFTSTPDLDADFPAHAARRLGWTDVPLLGAQEVGVPGAMPRVVRILLTVRTRPGVRDLVPVYLDGAVALRPDLSTEGRPPAGPRRRVAIIGLGQIGGSIGLGLGRAGAWDRTGYDVEVRARRKARARGAVDRVASSLAGACAEAELAILATPVDVLPEVIAQVAQALPRGAVLLDTGSARSDLVPVLRQAARQGIRAVGGHPLAGTEGKGIDAARADLFEGAGFVLWPARGKVPVVVRRLVRDLKARPLLIGPAEHDRALARTSHLPYVLSVALSRVGARAAHRGLAGPGFRDMTRLAASDPRMALAYCRANRKEVRSAWGEIRRAVEGELAALSRRRRGPS